jgi:hypothetical protein
MNNNLDSLQDGNHVIDYNILKNYSFDKEKDITNFLVDNIEDFVRIIFNDELISFEQNKDIEKRRRGIQPSGRRVDLIIVGKKKTYIIELKNPPGGSESRYAIGQILDYGREFLDPKKELVIITSRYDHHTAKTIKFYNLPIRYIYVDKKRFLEYLRDE